MYTPKTYTFTKPIIIKAATDEERKATAGKLEAGLSEVQSDCKARLLSLDNLLECIELAENVIFGYGWHKITKKDLEGTRVLLDPHAQDFPNAYKYIPESTQAEVVYTRGTWRIAEVSRDICKAGKHECTIYLSDSAKSAIIKAIETGKHDGWHVYR